MSLTKPNKKTRNTIYKNALTGFKLDIKEFKASTEMFRVKKPDGMCMYIFHEYGEVYNKYIRFRNMLEMQDYFPELISIRPKKNVHHPYWWKFSNWNLRIRKFNKIIKDTK